METQEHLIKMTKIKLVIMSLSTILPILLLVIFQFWVKNLFQEGSVVYDLIVFRYGIFVLLEGYIGLKIAKYVKILTSVDYASAEIIRKNDERNKFIKLKTESFTIKTSVYLMGIALIVTAFINRYIFYTLLGVLFVNLVIYFIVKIYYSKKY